MATDHFPRLTYDIGNPTIKHSRKPANLVSNKRIVFTLLELILIMFFMVHKNGFWALFFCVYIMCVPNDYHSHLLKYGKMHRFGFLSFHSLQ